MEAMQTAQDIALLSLIAVGLLGGALCVIEVLIQRASDRRRRIDSAKLNQFKPGCFQANKPWEDLE